MNYVLKCPVSATHSSIEKCIPTQLIFHSIYKWKSTFLVINASQLNFAVKACPLGPAWSLSYSFFPLTHSASRVFSPLKHFFFFFLMRTCVFHVLNSSKPGWRGRSKLGLWAVPLLHISLLSHVNVRRRCFG